jgi:folate-binding protein YgfZ
MIDAVEAALVAEGWSRADEAALQASRIEAGLPAWGVEMNDETLAQEAALDALGAISFSKGCYTGQEVVARIHFRGHVNRLLRRLTSATTLPVGALVYDEAGAEVGDVRSSALSATRGALAIAMIRREAAVGSRVAVRAEGAGSESTQSAMIEALA